MIRTFLLASTFLAALAARPADTAQPDEGMWRFDKPPRKVLKERYGFEPDQAWLDHLRVASVRFNSGGSGSFVSPHGLVMTNHHVALESIQKLSGAGRDLVKNGFLARTNAEELRCKDLELNVLMSIEDVTRRVREAADAREEMRQIEAEEAKKSGLRCDVVTLYNGGVYALYRYQQYTDVRLVMAPELAVGFYGGDPDNFTYPRYNLDFSFFRVYADGQPLQGNPHLRWARSGVQEGDLVFVSGHPGDTARLETVAQLEAYRDVIYPMVLRRLDRFRAALREYSAKGEEQGRQIQDEVFGLENSFKALSGELDALRDSVIMKAKADQEAAFLATEAGTKVKDAFGRIAAGRERLRAVYPTLIHANLPGKLGSLTQELLQYHEVPAENEAARKTAELALFSTAPIHLEMEEVQLRACFAAALQDLGKDNPLVQAMLADPTAGEEEKLLSPEAAARAIVAGTKVHDLETRQKLAKGSIEDLIATKDPMVNLIVRIEQAVAPLRGQLAPIFAAERKLEGEIADARFAAYGEDVYPDATFTLRLSFGVVKGYELGTTFVPYKTTFGGLFDRHDSFDGKPPYHLPERMLQARTKIDLRTPLNFVCTADIIGGNSGSPVVNRASEVVGLIFDGNIQSLSGRFQYDERIGRSVAVDARGIVEALRKVYDAGALADELTGHGGTR
ncbi:MAG: S46 family peptidase [Planctomycetes bacterium]|nr:S46 family peptidase [Planctomycetota bacterium]